LQIGVTKFLIVLIKNQTNIIMKSFEKILNQPSTYLSRFSLAWQNLKIAEREWKKLKTKKR
jgi:hypothetical protein